MHRYLVHIIFVFIGFAYSSLRGEIRGKIDVGPTLLDIDILESGKTIQTLHMTGGKADATVLIYQGLCIKPSFMWGKTWEVKDWQHRCRLLSPPDKKIQDLA